MKRALTRMAAVACLALAAHGAFAQDDSRDRRDPLESFNRAVFSFNDTVDTAVLKPLAQGYQAVLPEWVRTGVSNFFGNLGDIWSTVNLVLQAKPQRAGEMGFRVLTNTFFGLGGLLDPASEMHLDRQTEDFGQTLGRWGVGPGPYLVLPLLGPSTLRDTAALPLDWKASPSGLAFREPADRNGATVLNVVNTRANLLGAGKVLDDVALDKYTLLRDAFLARRRNQVYDGDPPDEDPPPSK